MWHFVASIVASGLPFCLSEIFEEQAVGRRLYVAHFASSSRRCYSSLAVNQRLDHRVENTSGGINFVERSLEVVGGRDGCSTFQWVLCTQREVCRQWPFDYSTASAKVQSTRTYHR